MASSVMRAPGSCPTELRDQQSKLLISTEIVPAGVVWRVTPLPVREGQELRRLS
jgi:hypothetical protein